MDPLTNNQILWCLEDPNFRKTLKIVRIIKTKKFWAYYWQKQIYQLFQYRVGVLNKINSKMIRGPFTN